MRSRPSWLVVAGLPALVLGAFLCWALTGSATAGELLFGHGRLFEVSKAGAPPSYVFPTIHLNDRDVLKLPRQVAGALKRSRIVPLENDGTPDDQAASIRAMFYADGRLLPDVIGPELYGKVLEHAAALGLRQEVLPHLKPGALWFILGKVRIEHGSGSEWPVLDQALAGFASRRNIRVVGLDLDAETDALLTGRFTEREQVLLLEHALASWDEEPGSSTELREAYLAGDLAALYEPDASPNRTPMDPALELKLQYEFLTARNQRWIPRMKAELEQGGAFVAVGAMHLPGGDGVLHLLEKEGFTVRVVH
jgi:uncharacterized protein YbaP (TraB family)